MRRRGRRKLNYNFNQRYFKPRGIPLRELDELSITYEELEVLRLRYLEHIDQVAAATRMGISQSQYQRDLTSVLEKVTKALIEGYAINIMDRDV